MSPSLDRAPNLAPMSTCACGAAATANGVECPEHFLERLRSVRTGFAPTRSLGAGQMDRTASKRWEGRLEDYRRVRHEGSQPATTRRRDIEASKRISDRTGQAHRADTAGGM